MKSLFKIFTAAFIGTVLLASCNKEQKSEIYTADGDGLYSFVASSIPDIEFTPNVSSAVVDILRSTTKGEATLSLTVTQTDPNGPCTILNIPSQVNFADGESIVHVPITFNEGIKEEVTYNVTLAFAEDQCTPGGVSEVSFACTYALWESLGMGQLYDNLAFGVDLNDDQMLTTAEEYQIQEVEVLKSLTSERWRIVAPWGNRTALGKPWPNPLSTFSNSWEFYLLEDGEHVAWSGYLRPGINYDDGSVSGEIVYLYPTDYSPSLTDYNSNIGFIKDGIVSLSPVAIINGTTSWFGQTALYLALPGYDIVSELELY